MSETKGKHYAIPGVLVFELSGKKFCADIRNLYGFQNAANICQNERIDRDRKIYFNYFGRRIPFINFHRVFELTAPPHTDETRILFLENSGTMISLISDRIVEFIAFDEKLTVHQKIMSDENYLPSDYLQYDGKNFLFPHYSKIITAWKKSNKTNNRQYIRRTVMPGKNTLPP